MSSSSSIIGECVAAASVSGAAGGFLPDIQGQFGFSTAARSGPGIYVLDFDAGAGMGLDTAIIHATVRNVGVPTAADNPTVRQLSASQIEVRVGVAGAAADRDFDVEVLRMS